MTKRDCVHALSCRPCGTGKQQLLNKIFVNCNNRFRSFSNVKWGMAKRRNFQWECMLTNMNNLSGLSFVYDKLMNAPDLLNPRENMTSCFPIWCKIHTLETHFTSRISCKGTEGQKPSRPSEWQYRRNVCNLTDYKLFSGVLQCFDPSPVLFVLSFFEATSDLGRSNLCVFCVQLQCTNTTW